MCMFVFLCSFKDRVHFLHTVVLFLLGNYLIIKSATFSIAADSCPQLRHFFVDATSCWVQHSLTRKGNTLTRKGTKREPSHSWRRYLPTTGVLSSQQSAFTVTLSVYPGEIFCGHASHTLLSVCLYVFVCLHVFVCLFVFLSALLSV